MALQSVLDQTLRLAQQAGHIAMESRQAMGAELKGDGSIVTAGDRAVETFLRKELTALVPGTGVWGEEEGNDGQGPEGIWLVDPIDGTSNYSFGSPLWGISIALARHGRIVLGVINLPDLMKVYAAAEQIPATCNGRPLPLIPPGPVKNHELVSYADVAIRTLGDQLPGKSRYLGAWVVEAAWFFEGWFRGVMSWRASLYDVAASMIIAEQLGADVRYTTGAPVAIDPLIGMKGMEHPMLLFPKDSGFYLPESV